MAITASNIMHSHRGCYFEYVGDGASTSISVPLTPTHYAGQAISGVATVRTGATAFTNESGKGGFLFPAGTNVAVASATVANGSLTVQTSAAVGNGVKAYAAFIFDKTTPRN